MKQEEPTPNTQLTEQSLMDLRHQGVEIVIYDPCRTMTTLHTLSQRIQEANASTSDSDQPPQLASITYLEQREDILKSVVALQEEIKTRQHLLQEQQQRRPLLLIIDDLLPFLHAFSSEDQQQLRMLIQRIILEARKWRCFFCERKRHMLVESVSQPAIGSIRALREYTPWPLLQDGCDLAPFIIQDSTMEGDQ